MYIAEKQKIAALCGGGCNDLNFGTKCWSGHNRRFPNPDGMMPKNWDGSSDDSAVESAFAIAYEAADSVNRHCASMCNAQVSKWFRELSLCRKPATWSADSVSLYFRFKAFCEAGCDFDMPMGSSSLKAGRTTVYGDSSLYQIVQDYITLRDLDSVFCNPYLITPPPARADNQFPESDINQADTCTCNTLQDWIDEYNGLAEPTDSLTHWVNNKLRVLDPDNPGLFTPNELQNLIRWCRTDDEVAAPPVPKRMFYEYYDVYDNPNRADTTTQLLFVPDSDAYLPFRLWRQFRISDTTFIVQAEAIDEWGYNYDSLRMLQRESGLAFLEGMCNTFGGVFCWTYQLALDADPACMYSGHSYAASFGNNLLLVHKDGHVISNFDIAHSSQKVEYFGSEYSISNGLKINNIPLSTFGRVFEAEGLRTVVPVGDSLLAVFKVAETDDAFSGGNFITSVVNLDQSADSLHSIIYATSCIDKVLPSTSDTTRFLGKKFKLDEIENGYYSFEYGSSNINGGFLFPTIGALDHSGEIVWEKIIDLPVYDRPSRFFENRAFSRTADGKYLACISVYDSVYARSYYYDSLQHYILKFSAAGDIIWSKRIVSSSDDFIQDFT